MKQLILSILACWSVLAARGQVLRTNVGVSHTYLNFYYLGDNGLREDQYNAPLTSFAIGEELSYLDKGIYSMSSELSLVQIGGKYTANEKKRSFYVQSPEQIRTTYLSLNTLLNFNPIRGKTRLQLGLGPRIDVLVGGKDQAPFNWGTGSLTKLNAGFTGVAGLYRTTGKWEWGIKFSYLNRFKKITSYTPVLPINVIKIGADATAQTLLWQLSIGKAIR